MSYDSDREMLPALDKTPEAARRWAGRRIDPAAVGHDGRHVDWAPGVEHAAYLARRDAEQHAILSPAGGSFATGTADIEQPRQAAWGVDAGMALLDGEREAAADRLASWL